MKGKKSLSFIENMFMLQDSSNFLLFHKKGIRKVLHFRPPVKSKNSLKGLLSLIEF